MGVILRFCLLYFFDKRDSKLRGKEKNKGF